MNNLNGKKFLIVEDLKNNRDGIVRILMYDYEIPEEYIIEAEDSKSANEKISEDEPDIVLLDLKIPRQKGNEPDIENALDVLKEIELFNFKNNKNIKVIIISGSVEDQGIQQLVIGDRSNIITFLDKNELAIDSKLFKEKLRKHIEIGLRGGQPKRKIDYSAIRRSIVKDLEKYNSNLFHKIENEILLEFEKLNVDDLDESTISKSIILNCGEIIEDIIALFEDKNVAGSTIEYSLDDNSVLKKLTKLSGRKHIGWDKEKNNEAKFENIDPKHIRRISQEYSHRVYQMSSQARHSKEGDNYNNKWFTGYRARFTREDAAISINLIVPLIQDFIEHLKRQQ